MTSLMPNTNYGWMGLALMGGTLLYHKMLGSVGLMLGLGLGIYLYFVVDDQ
jgi:hypothetical protein